MLLKIYQMKRKFNGPLLSAPVQYEKSSAGWIQTGGRMFYGVAIVGVGLMHFLYEGFRPLIYPCLLKLPLVMAFSRIWPEHIFCCLA
jgi:hypothetical protein